MVVSTSHNNSDHIGRGYHKPTRGILSYLPSSFVPYAELMRLNKPVGTLNIYFPYLFGSLFAACARYPFVTPLSILSANLKLFPMAFLLRSAGCTWNDLVDRDLDRKVARCRLRPIARYAISPRSGFIFYVIQMLVWLAILLQTDAPTISYAFSGVLMGHLYPFAKRFTYYPQVVLGFTLSWGILVGCVCSYPFLLFFFPELFYPYTKPFQSHRIWRMIVLLSIFSHSSICGAEKTGLTRTFFRYSKVSRPHR